MASFSALLMRRSMARRGRRTEGGETILRQAAADPAWRRILLAIVFFFFVEVVMLSMRYRLSVALVTVPLLVLMALWSGARPVHAQAAATVDGWSKIEAESYTSSGGSLQVCNGVLCYVGANAWTQYNGVDLHSGTNTIQINAANGGGNTAIQVWVGGANLGTLTVPGTGGWDTYQTKSLTLPAQNGTQDVRLVFVNGNINVDWFQFSGTTTPPPPAPTTFAINAGGSAYTSTDGTTFAADTGSTGGSTYTNAVPIGATTDDPLFQTERYGNFSYAKSLTNATYQVTLYFAETYHTQAGKRVFDVLMEGTEKITDLDIYAKAGANNAYTTQTTVAVTDGTLNIQFVSNVENAKVNAIKVTPAGATAAFTYSPTNPTTGQTVSLDGSTSTSPGATITTYTWNFGDGTTAIGRTTIHAWTTTGDKTVTLTITDSNANTATTTRTIKINNGDPIADFTITPPNPKPGDTVTLNGTTSTDPNGTITTYTWNFGDNTTATGPTTTHTWTTEGTYNITLTVTDNDGRTNTLTKTVAVRKSSSKPRVVVLTDISTWEPDDHESLTRLLAHADMYEIEALVLTTGWSIDTLNDPTKSGFISIINDTINAYEKDLPNLMKRSGQTGFAQDESRQDIGYWPSAQYLRDRTMTGSRNRGVQFLGASNDSPGSNQIIRLADENDARPLYVTVWGGGNTAAQSIWRVKQDRTQEQFTSFLRKLRVYTITDQDRSSSQPISASSHQWMRGVSGGNLLFIWDECAWKFQNGTGKSNWSQYQTHIQGHGNLGRQYPNYVYGVEGDTPSFLYVTPTGLNDPDSPNQASWGGTFTGDSNNVWTGAGSCGTYNSRFYSASFNNFAARMDWAQSGSGNRNPIIVLDGDDGVSVLMKTPKQGTSVTLDASKTFDPDGNGLRYNWWIQSDAGTYSGPVTIANSTSSTATINVPANAAGKSFHVILEVIDNGTHNLSDYRRILFQPTS
ncbi:nucleoside hydrolase-like domain-containing protein [Micromonospora aurantiaca (nom. illeg.)]